MKRPTSNASGRDRKNPRSATHHEHATANPSIPQSARPPAAFPIVGVGASAGGLEAFTELLKHLPLDTGLGFVLVQHLDPQHESALTQLLARATRMPVREVTNNLPVEANHVYIIPPNTSLTMAQGILKLQPRPSPAKPHRSIDSFFESLAQDQRERAIGVILSGTATDGTLGLEAIEAEGGITFAQDDSAKYDSMPRSAIVAGCVDFVLSPEEIAKELARIARHPYVAGQGHELPANKEGEREPAAAGGETPLPARGRVRRDATTSEAREVPPAPLEGQGVGLTGADDGFKKILLLLRNHSGVDFSLYKTNTIQRRIARRMVLNKHTTLEGYAKFVRGNAKELDAVYSDVLISVTSFFRNPEAFDVLQRKVFPRLLHRRGDQPVRVWVLGCSTGQEAYSIAMAFAESSENSTRPRNLQVFATDLNEAVLDRARHGLYTKALAQDISPERLRRFFVEEQGGYRIIKPLREMVVFARQNLISDPPFSRMDLISCRNLLIYLEPSLQNKALPTFHYGLKPEGFLLLGASESIGSFTDLFEPIDRKHKIYSRKNATTPALHLPAHKQHGIAPRQGPRPLSSRLAGKGQAERPEDMRLELNAQREADRLMVSQFAPPGVLVDAELQILQFRGATSAYLEPPTGKASFDVLKMAREGLMLPLLSAIKKAKKENATVNKENIRIVQDGQARTVNVQVIPLRNLRQRCFLILFEETRESYRSKQRERREDQSSSPSLSSLPSVKASSRRVARLERELSETRDYLQSLQEQHEAASEELQASNEEVQSANEELQSVNEELETSKEELESANEELTTVNEEMVTRNTELSRLNSDLVNLQTCTRLAIVLLGRDLAIRRFSAQAEKQFNLLATDIGRPFTAVRHNLELPQLDAFLGEVIATVREREQEVLDKEGRWYSFRARPYMTLDNKVDGAVLVLVDITDLKRAQEQLRQARDAAEAIIRTARDPLLILRADLRVDRANHAFYKTFKVSPQETENVLIYELDGGQWRIPKLRELLEEIIPRNSFFDDLEVTHDFERIGQRTMLLNARRLDSASRAPQGILLGIEDITERMHLDEGIRRSEERFRSLVLASAQVVWTTNAAGLVEQDSPSWRAFTGQTLDQWKGWGWLDAIHPDDRKQARALWSESVENQRVYETEYRLRWADGAYRWTAARAVPVRDADGAIREWVGTNTDITERKRAAEALRETEDLYHALFDLGPVAIYSIDAAGVIQHFNRRAIEMWGREPVLGTTDERFCGSFQMFRPDGTVLPHDQCPMAEVVSGKIAAVHDAEVIIERPDGSRVTVLVNIRTLKNARGETTGAINCFYDITERTKAEEARKGLTDQLADELAGTRRLQEISTLLIHGGDIEAMYDKILEAAIAGMQSDMGSLQILDQERGELRLLASRGFHPESAKFWKCVQVDSGSSCAVALREGERVIVPDIETFEPFAGTPDLGEYRRSNIRAVQSTPLITRSGRLIGMISTHWRNPRQPAEREFRLLDVLARQAADLMERAQTEGVRAKLASIVESSDDAIVSKDLNGIITSWNKGAERLFGYTAHEAIGQPVTMLIPPDRLDEEPRILERIRRGQAIEHYETVRRRKDGTLLDLSLTVSPIRNIDGHVVGASKIARDITDRKKAEQALRESEALLANRAEQLEHLVAERTARLQDTIAELEHFSYTITHDMRAPLRAMKGFGDILLSESGHHLPPEGANNLRRIISAAGRMDALIQGSLQYAKAVRENIPLAAVEPAPVLRGILESYPTLQHPHVEIEVVEPLPAVSANESGLAQCFSNLLVNAIKFVKPGQVPHVRIWAERRGDSVRFWFEDNGIGIPKEYQERIFDMFQQLDKSYEGTGIGLALVRKTTQRMKGQVGVESAPGQGSRFWLEFKQANPAAQKTINPL